MSAPSLLRADGLGPSESAPEKSPSCLATLSCLLTFLSSGPSTGAPCSPLLPAATELTHRNLRPEQPLWKTHWMHFKNKQKTLKIKTFYEVGVWTCSNEPSVLSCWMQILSISPESQKRSVSVRPLPPPSRPACSAFCKLVLTGSSAGQGARSPRISCKENWSLFLFNRIHGSHEFLISGCDFLTVPTLLLCPVMELQVTPPSGRP